MSNDKAFLIALGITLGASLLVVLYLQRPLHRVLTDLCGKDERARFWTAYSNVILVLVPAAAMMLGHPTETQGDSPVYAVVDQLKWALLGLIVAVCLIALAVAAFVWPAATPILSVSRSQVDDLQRLLAKVEEIRAREIVSRTSTAAGPPA